MDLSAITRPLVYSILVMPLLAVAVAILFRHQHRLINFSTVLFSFLSLLASLYVAPVFIDRPDHYLWDLMYLDSLSIYFVLLVNLVAFFASIYTIPFLRHDRERNKQHDPGRFHTFLNLFHLTMLVVPMVNNLVVLWIAIELTTIFSTVLVRYQRSRLAIEASWKFMIITTTGIIFALLGTLFLVNSASEGLVDRHMAMNWSELVKLNVAENLNSNFVMLSFLFIMIGYGTKAGLAPMHTWLPDGHGEAPPPVSALLSGVMLKSALYAILRFYTITNLNQGSADFTSILLMAFGLFSLTVATPFILKKNKFKRVLAYHSLEHMGIITFGIGVGTPLALLGALLHTLNHALTKALMFLVYGNIQYEHMKRCDDGSGAFDEEATIRGVLKSMPLSGTLLGFGGLALVGSPPFSIFMSEFIILWAAIQKMLIATSDQTPYTKILQAGAILLFVVTVTVIFGGLVNHLSKLLLGKSPIPTLEPVLTPASVFLGVPFLALIAILLFFGILIPTWPIDLPKLLEKAVEILLLGIRRTP